MSIVLTKRPKIIFCGVARTFIANNAWYELTSGLHGDMEEHYQIYTNFIKKQITFEEMKQQLFEVWRKGYGGPIPKRILRDILFKVQLHGEAFSLFTDLRNRGYKICLISSYMELFVEQVAQKLQIDDWFANIRFQFDEHDNFVDYVVDGEIGQYKVKIAEQFLKDQGVGADECLVLGSDDEEIELFRHFPGIAINSEDKELISLSWKQIKYPQSVLQVLNQFE